MHAIPDTKFVRRADKINERHRHNGHRLDLGVGDHSPEHTQKTLLVESPP